MVLLGVRTTKAIATISFNTPDYLRLKLEELRKSGKISFWAFIEHQPEDDEGGKKLHNHTYIEPSRMIQTDDIKEFLKEFDPHMPDKPRGCLTFTSSRFDHWYMYALHDKRYLAQKGQTRRFHYSTDNIISSDPDELIFRIKSIDLVSLSPYNDMIDAITHGVTWQQYFQRGTVPLPQIALFERAWALLANGDMTYRSGRSGHPMVVDENTGEVISSPERMPGDD